MTDPVAIVERHRGEYARCSAAAGRGGGGVTESVAVAKAADITRSTVWR
jgi:hypothetical protein